MGAIQIDKALSDDNFVVMELAQISTERRFMVAYRRKNVAGVTMRPMDSMVNTDIMKVVKVPVVDLLYVDTELGRAIVISSRIKEAKEDLIKEHHLFDEKEYDEECKQVEVLERANGRPEKAKEGSKAVDVKAGIFTNEWFSGLLRRKK